MLFLCLTSSLLFWSFLCSFVASLPMALLFSFGPRLRISSWLWRPTRRSCSPEPSRRRVRETGHLLGVLCQRQVFLLVLVFVGIGFCWFLLVFVGFAIGSLHFGFERSCFKQSKSKQSKSRATCFNPITVSGNSAFLFGCFDSKQKLRYSHLYKIT